MTDDRASAVRAEAPHDAVAVAALVCAAFGSDSTQLEARLVEAVRRGTGYWPELALVAEVAGRVVGHVVVSGALLRDGDRERPVATLSPLAVLPGFQRRGIGSALVREVTRLADLRGEPLVALQGDPRYYGRFGFEPAVTSGITMDLPSWAPPEAAQVLRLREYDPALRGHLVFPALDEVDPGTDAQGHPLLTRPGTPRRTASAAPGSPDR